MIHDEEQLGRSMVRPHRRPLGAHRIVYGKGSWPRGCMVGPDFICLAVTFVLIWAPTLGLLVAFAAEASVGIVLGIVFSLGLVTATLNAAAFSDPGIIPKNEFNDLLDRDDVDLPPTEPGTGRTLCSRCLVYRPRGAFHCKDCDCCVEELDHHCPWTGHCIGKGNMLAFRVYLGTLSLHIVVVVVFAMILAAREKH